MSKTTITLDTTTKDKLDEHGKKGDSYDFIINKILKDYNDLLDKMDI